MVVELSVEVESEESEEFIVLQIILEGWNESVPQLLQVHSGYSGLESTSEFILDVLVHPKVSETLEKVMECPDRNVVIAVGWMVC